MFLKYTASKRSESFRGTLSPSRGGWPGVIISLSVYVKSDDLELNLYALTNRFGSSFLTP